MSRTMNLRLAEKRKAAKAKCREDDIWKARLALDKQALEAKLAYARRWADDSPTYGKITYHD